MSASTRIFYTPAEYLALEHEAETKHELVNGEIFAMSGGSPAQSRIAFNLTGQLSMALAGGPCRGYTSDLRVRVPETDLYTYPDLTVVCGEPEFDPNDSYTLLNPTLIVEVLSPSTEAWDRGGKFAHYRRISSLQEYLLVSSDRPLLERYLRQGTGGEEWLLTAVDSFQGVLALQSVPVRLALGQVYDDVRLPEHPLR